MTIAQALKEKNKKVKHINSLWHRIQNYNSLIDGAERPYDIEHTFNEVSLETAALAELKTKIHNASAPVRLKIFQLSEIKNAIKNIQSVNTTKGRFKERYSDEAVNMTSQLDTTWKDVILVQYSELADSIQDELDKFNHTTNI